MELGLRCLRRRYCSIGGISWKLDSTSTVKVKAIAGTRLMGARKSPSTLPLQEVPSRNTGGKGEFSFQGLAPAS